MSSFFENFDITSFWEQSEYADREYVDTPLSDEMISEIDRALGYKLPLSYFADCPSSGHDMLCLDYRNCDCNGEPQVVHIAQEFDYKITFVAQNFHSFIQNLEAMDTFDI